MPDYYIDLMNYLDHWPWFDSLVPYESALLFFWWPLFVLALVWIAHRYRVRRRQSE